ncbi:hypothetical protein LTR36_005017 [Oleoguttula mirabilis]|uniref:Sedlin n=1 Tax=Oleoguttula mirabilis TaxID=1507867 RepID=A0AAV9JWK2_9PEZI|nr:hypothetical protein LTR36_005017 [Oleoguttula mirabilis]
MEARSPSIAAIGVIGRHNNPLHISLFDATGPGYEHARDKLEYSFMLNSCLDIFEARMPNKTIGHDFGLLHALDERIAMYGWLLNTGVKLVIVVDMEGRPALSPEAGKTAILGLRNSDLTPAFQALQTAYISLLRNPFYVPDDHDPRATKGGASLQIASPRFIKEVERVGKAWYPGTTAI